MKYNVSVITPTYRVGGVDVAFHSLKNQKMKNFEFVLIDELYDARHELVEEKAREMGINLKHVRPMTISKSSFSTQWNAGFVYASGELIFTLDDYTYLPPDTLQRHWDAYVKSKRTATLTGVCNEIEFPEAKYSFPIMKGKEFLHGEPDYYSVFKEPAEKIFPDKMKLIREDGRWAVWEEDAEGYLPQGTLKVYVNVSIPLDICVALNGFDVGYDAGDGYRDQDLYARAEIYGHRFVFDPGCKIYHAEHAKPFPRVFTEKTYRDHPEGLDPLDVNAGYFRSRLKAIYSSQGALLPAMNPYSIASARGLVGSTPVAPREPKFRFAPPRVKIQAEYREIQDMKRAVTAGRSHNDLLHEFFLSKRREVVVYGDMQKPDPLIEKYFTGELRGIGEISEAQARLAALGGSARKLAWADRSAAMWLRAKVGHDSVLYTVPDDVFSYSANARRVVQGIDYSHGAAKWVALLNPAAEAVAAAKTVAGEGVLVVSNAPVRGLLRSAGFNDMEFTWIEQGNWHCGVGQSKAPAVSL